MMARIRVHLVSRKAKDTHFIPVCCSVFPLAWLRVQRVDFHHDLAGCPSLVDPGTRY